MPDRSLLVTLKGGDLVRISADGANVSAPISGVPAVDTGGQGGLLDVALDPQFATNRLVYLAYAEPGSGGTNGLAVARGVLSAGNDSLSNVRVIFQQTPKVGSDSHFGSRLIFRGDGTLFITLGERDTDATRPLAQDVTSLYGKVVRINADGSLPADNPFASQGGSAAAVWTYGHRNPQAAVLNPATGELWVAEHGPQGGDEVNVSVSGRNFGWPTVSYGCPYGQPFGNGCRIGGGVHTGSFVPPVAYWYAASTAPGGMAFYNGTTFPEWNGNLFVGGLATGSRTLWRLVLGGTGGVDVTRVEAMFVGQHEIRCVTLGPDGLLYLISRSSGAIYRVDR